MPPLRQAADPPFFPVMDVRRGTLAPMDIIRFMVKQPCPIVNRFRPRGANIYTCDREKDMNKP